MIHGHNFATSVPGAKLAAVSDVNEESAKAAAAETGAKSSIWPQMLADVTGKTFERLDREDTATWGVALLAAKGVGEITSIHDIAKRHICVKEIFEPDAEKVKIYQPYIDFYDKLKKEMHNMFYEFGRFRGNQ